VSSIRVTCGEFFIPVSPSFNCSKCVEVPFQLFFFFFFFLSLSFFVRLFRHSARGAHETLVGGMHSVVAKEKGQNNRECENWSAQARIVSIQLSVSIQEVGARAV
jgi:hypothetical protein